MSVYPQRMPVDLDDVRRGHIVGKIVEVNVHNMRWLVRALDIAMREIASHEAYQRDVNQALNEGDGVYRP